MEYKNIKVDVIANAVKKIIETMDKNKYEWEKEISGILDKQQNQSNLTIKDHIEAMVFALLSKNRSELNEIFNYYDAKYLKNEESDTLIKKIKNIKCGNRQIKKQMDNLKHNIEVLERINTDEQGGINNYYANTNKVDLVEELSSSEGKYKLKYMGKALVCEYLKSVGVDVIKPDIHVCRILGRLCNENCKALNENEALMVCEEISKKLKCSNAEVDTILWQYCADGKFNYCTKDDPKCDKCKARDLCHYQISRKTLQK